MSVKWPGTSPAPDWQSGGLSGEQDHFSPEQASIHSNGLNLAGSFSPLTPIPPHPLGFRSTGSQYAQRGSYGLEEGSTGLGVRRPECEPGSALAVCLGVRPSLARVPLFDM